jgi:DNA-binding GntR family transcriptional regulator
MLKVKKSNPLYEQIYENIKQSIVSGELKPGERIVDAWFAEKLKVSRSPVREAFRKLEQDGLIINHEGTTAVYQPNLQDMVELFQVRAGLEGMAVLLATQAMSDEQINDLGETLMVVKEALKDKRVPDIVKMNTHFHESIISYSQNAYLSKVMEKINTKSLLYRKSFFTNFADNDVFLNEHIEIWQAMKERNGVLASDRMRSHILNDLDYLIKELNTQESD